MSESTIEWTQSTWNPVTGCTTINAGCANCYAERMAGRLLAMGQRNYRNGFDVTCHEHVLQTPLRWRKSRTIFVNSMSDLFHEDIEDDFIMRVFDVILFFFKQWGGVNKKKAGRLLQGGTWDQMPAHAKAVHA